jgi:tetratricopeptide (TPR) repeat protein
VRQRRDHREVYSRVLLIAALGLSAMGLGGLHWAALVPSALCAITAGFFAIRSVPGRAPYVPALLPLGLALFTLLQLLPLPIVVLRVLSPHMVPVWEEALSPFGEGLRTWGTLSADPTATLVEALKWLAYSGSIAAAIAAGARRGARFGAVALFYCAVLVGVTTAVHGLANVQRVYGVYIPTFHASRWHVGPFLNPNNLAGYLNLGMLSGLGLMMSRKPGAPRPIVGIGVASLVAVVVLSGSRAGLVATLAGLAVFGALAMYVRREQGITSRLSPSGLFATLGGIIASGALLAWLGSSRDTWHDLFDRNIEKIDVMGKVMPMIADHTFFGVGRGAFESVFPAYHFGAANVVYAHPENFALQWIAEWGIPVGLGALAVFGWIFVGAFRDGRRSLTGAGIFAGLFALILQNFLDLGLELPGVAFAATTALGVLWGHDHKDALEEGIPRAERALPRFVAWFELAAGMALSAMIIVGARSNATKDRIRIHDLVSRTQLHEPEAVASTLGELRSVMLKHPADPYFPRVGGLLAFYTRQNAVPWMARSLDRGLEVGPTHFALARILAGLGARDQALLELRLASTFSPGLGTKAAKVLVSMTKDFDDIMSATPEGALGQRVLYAAALNLKRADYPELRLRCLAAGIERSPDSALVRGALAEDLLAAIASRESRSPCANDRQAQCAQLVTEEIAAVQKLTPEEPRALILKAKLLIVEGQATEAEALLRKGCQRYTYAFFAECQRNRVAAASATGDRELVAAASRDLAGGGCVSGRSCGDLYSFLGSQAETVGDVSHALSYYKRAAAEDPNDRRWASIARTASLVGDNAVSRDALTHLNRLHPEDADVRRSLEEQRRRLFLDQASRARH